MPALFIAGRQDPVLAMITLDALETMQQFVPRPAPPVIIERAGHWVQQEQPTRVNEAMLNFLSNIGPALS